jgi:hypothetical protein
MKTRDEYLAKIEDQLKRIEERLERYAEENTPEQKAAGEQGLANVQEKRLSLLERIEALRTDTGERFDVLRMGVESAWSELKVAFETATGPLHEEAEEQQPEGELEKTG